MTLDGPAKQPERKLGERDGYVFIRYEAQSAPSDPKLMALLENLDQVLSTFKFTTIIDTSMWRTYKGTGAYSFEFRYPSDWVVTSADKPSVTLTRGPQKINLSIGNDNVNKTSVLTWILSQPGDSQMVSLTPINGLEAVQYTTSGTIFLGKTGDVRIVTIQPTNVAGSGSQLLPIVSTFKFTQ